MRVLLSLAGATLVVAQTVMGNGRVISYGVAPGNLDDTTLPYSCTGGPPIIRSFDVLSLTGDKTLTGSGVEMVWNPDLVADEAACDDCWSLGSLSSPLNTDTQTVEVEYTPARAGVNAVWMSLQTDPIKDYGMVATTFDAALSVFEVSDAIDGKLPYTRYDFGTLDQGEDDTFLTEGITRTFSVTSDEPCAVPITRVYISYSSDHEGAETDAFTLEDVDLPDEVIFGDPLLFDLKFQPTSAGFFVAYITIESESPPSYTELVVSAFVKADCIDFKLSNGDPWHDSFGSLTDPAFWGYCDWYAYTGEDDNEDRCFVDGDMFPFPQGTGWTANRACCVCGGGVAAGDIQPEEVQCQDYTLPGGETWYDSFPNQPAGCDYYALNPREFCANEGTSYNNPAGSGWTATVACCVCGGGLLDGETQPAYDVCEDYTFYGAEWTDNYPDYPSSCEWYQSGPERCAMDGDLYPFPKWAPDWTANEVCCECGGGFRPSLGESQPELPECVDWSLPGNQPWVDGYPEANEGCEFYAETNGACVVDGTKWANPSALWTASNVCCVCGGGLPPGQDPPALCTDYTIVNAVGEIVPWTDSFPEDPVGCDWYAQGARCTQYGDEFANPIDSDWGANVACCACGGGAVAGSVQPPQPN